MTKDEFIADTLKSINEVAVEEQKRAENLQKIFKSMEDLLKKIDTKFSEELKEIKKQTAEIKKNGGAGRGGSGGGSGSGSSGDGDARKAGKQAGQKMSTGIKEGLGVKGISTLLKEVSVEFSVWRHLFAGVVTEELKFMRQMRAVAFVTEGVTANTREMQEQFLQTGKIVKETGVHLGKFQALYSNILKTGLKAGKESVNVVKSGMNLAYMIGTTDGEIESLGQSLTNIFGAWNQQIGMSSNQLSQVSRLIQDTARNTGLAGEEMANVVKQSEQFLKNLRNTKTLTAATVGNVIELTAQATKLGVGDQMNAILDAATDSYKLYFEASQQTQTLLFQAANAVGRTAELRTGQLAKSKEGLKALASGFEQIVQKFGITMEEIDKLDPGTLSRLNMQFKNAYGMEIGEVQRMHEAIKNSGRTLSEQMQDINNQLSTQNLKVEERKKLEEDLLKVQTSAGFKFLNAIDEAGKSATSLSDAVSVASQKLGDDMAGDLATLGVNMSDPIKQVEEAARITAKKLVEMGGQDLTPQIEKAIGSGDMAEIRELLGQMNAEYNKIGVDQKAALDPISKVAKDVAQINETLRNVIAPWGRYFSTLVVALMSGVTILATIYTGFVGLKNVFGLLASFLGGGGSGGIGGAIGSALAPVVQKLGFGGGDKTAEAGRILSKEEKKRLKNEYKAKAGPDTPAPSLQERLAAYKEKKRASVSPSEALPGAGETQKLSDKIPNFNFSDIATTGKKLAQWGVALGALAVGLVALMSVVTLLSQKIMGMTGLTPQDIMITTGAIVALVAGAAAIVGAVTLANKGLQEYEANKKEVSVSWKTYWEIAKSLGLMLPAIIGLAAAVMFFGEKIIQATGMDMRASAQLVADIGALILGAAGIIGGIVAVGEALNKVVENEEVFENIKKNMWKAGSILVTMGAPILAMTVALAWFAGQLLGVLGIDSGTMAKLTMDIAAMMMAVGSITLAIIGASAGLWLLGTLAPKLLALAVPMAIGAGVFLVLGPAIVGLMAGFLKLIDWVMGVLSIDAAEAARIGENVASLMWSTAKIATSIAVVAPIFTALGALAWWNPMAAAALAGLMVLGGIVFGVIATAVVGLAAGMVAMVDAVMNKLGVDAKTAEDTAKKVDAMGTVIKAIGGALQSMTDTIVPFVGSSWFSGWLVDSPADDLIEAMPKFASDFEKIAMFISYGIIDPIWEYFPESTKVEEVAKEVEGMGRIMKGLDETLSHIGTTVTDFVTAPWYTAWLGDSPADDLWDAAPKFAKDFEKIAMFISYAIIDPIWEYFPESTKVEEVAKEVEGMGRIMKGLEETLSNLGTAVTDFVTARWGDSPADDLMDAMPVFKDAFEKIAKFIDEAVIDPIWKYFPESTKVEEVAKEVEGMGRIMPALSTTLGALNDSITDFVTQPSFLGFKGKSPAEKLWEAAPKFAKDFAKLAMFIAYGVIDPIWEYFPESTKVEEAAREVEGMASIMTSLQAMMNVLNESIVPMVSGTGWFGGGPSMMEQLTPKIGEFAIYFSTIADFLRLGVIEPIKKLPEAAELDQISQTLAALTAVLVNLAAAMEAMSAAAGQMGDGDYGQISNLLGDLDGIKPNKSKNKGIFDILFGPLTRPAMKDVKKKVTVTSKDTASITQQITDELYKKGLMEHGKKAKLAAIDTRRNVEPNLKEAENTSKSLWERLFGSWETQAEVNADGINNLSDRIHQQDAERLAAQTAQAAEKEKKSLPGSKMPKVPKPSEQARDWGEVNTTTAGALARRESVRSGAALPLDEEFLKQQAMYRSKHGTMVQPPEQGAQAQPAQAQPAQANLSLESQWRSKADAISSQLRDKYDPKIKDAIKSGFNKVEIERLQKLKNAANPMYHLDHINAIEEEIGRVKTSGGKKDAVEKALADLYRRKWEPIIKAGEEALQGGAANGMNVLVGERGPEVLTVKPLGSNFSPKLPEPLGGGLNVNTVAPSVAQLESTAIAGETTARPTLSPMPMMTADERAGRFQQEVRNAANNGDGKELASISQANNQQVNLLTMIHEGIMQLAELWRPSSTVQTGAGQRPNTAGHTPGRTSSDYAAWQVLQNNQASLATNQTFNA